MSDAQAALTAAQAVLAGEHACVYGYGVVGAHLPDDHDAARAALRSHRARRDTLTRLVREAGAQPVVAEPAYTLPAPVTDESGAVRLATVLERRLATLYADLAGAADTPQLRRFAAQGLVAAHRDALRSWNGEAVAFPGLGDRAGA
ncbi:uncharacterized protein DUF4439 [Haloactinopolyspora alba]|uniref:Uncharacterized protein DUF4439 n=1 Tax=Haloactinopolyspora alba TaxID=648780 RepID=A0A2P8DV95_9ACTN|nr:ferritin-like domain-containing protein [Haloactinopolyspora alba]PSL01140.1 uncharacterized protein DUF4439 [Haloactinopolyspora alba]